MATADEKELTNELITLCERYLKASTFPGAGKKQFDLNTKIRTLINDFSNNKNLDPKEFIKKLNDEDILTQIQKEKPIKNPKSQTEKQDRPPSTWGDFFIRLSAVFLGITALIARITTGRWDPARLLKNKDELFLLDLKELENDHPSLQEFKSQEKCNPYMEIKIAPQPVPYLTSRTKNEKTQTPQKQTTQENATAIKP